MENAINMRKLNYIRDNCPNTWEWMQHKARWEWMCLGAVLNNYEEHIDKLMEEEDGFNYERSSM